MSDHMSPDEDSPEWGEPREGVLADPGFADDLIAANNFKTFLIGRGIEVPAKLLEGLGEFVSRYDDEIRDYREYFRIQDKHRRGRLGFLNPFRSISS